MPQDKPRKPRGVSNRRDTATGVTAKQEAFLQHFRANGRIGAASYKATYAEGKKSSPGVCASEATRILSDPAVSARIKTLDLRAEETARANVAIDKNWVMERLVTIANRCLQAEQVLDNHGVPTGEYTFNATGANQALKLLGTEIGMFVERKEVRHGKIGSLSPEQKRSAMAALEEALLVARTGKRLPVTIDAVKTHSTMPSEPRK